VLWLDVRAEVRALATAPDGKALAGACADRVLRVWDRAGKELHRAPLPDFVARDLTPHLTYAPDGASLALGGSGPTVRLLDARGKELFTWRGFGRGVIALRFTTGGKQLQAVAADSTLRTWDRAHGKELRPEKTGYPDGLCAAFSGDRLLAVGSGTGCVGLWDRARGAPTGPVMGPREPIHALSFRPDG